MQQLFSDITDSDPAFRSNESRRILPWNFGLK